MLERQTRQEPVAASIELDINTSPGTAERGGGRKQLQIKQSDCIDIFLFAYFCFMHGGHMDMSSM